MNFDPFASWQALSAQALKDFWPRDPQAQSFGSFADTLERFNAAAAAFLSAPASAGTAGDTFSRFLREQFGNLRMPWNIDAGGEFGRGASGGAGAESLALGATREHQQRLQRIAEAVAAIDAAQRRLQLLWSDALREAATAYCGSLGTAQPSEASPEALRALYDRWIDCAEEAYGRMAHSQAYSTALADYVNAGSRWRAQMQAALEQWAKLLDLPTRSELNALIHRVNELQAAQREPARAARSKAAPRATRTSPAGAGKTPRRTRRARRP